MNIAIESTLAQGQKIGMGKYVFHLLECLAEIDKGNRYFLLHNTKNWEGPDFGSNFEPVSYYMGKQSLAIRWKLNRILKRINADLYHATCTTGVPTRPIVPVVTTVHDIYPLLAPGKVSSVYHMLFKKLINWTVAYTDFFIYNSLFTKLEFSVFFNVSDDKGKVIYLGPSLEGLKRVERQGTIGPMICIGAIEQRKEQLFLLEVYKEVLAVTRNIPDLIFIGPDKGLGNKLEEKITKYALNSRVRWERYITDEALANYFHSSSLMLYPSSYEGFGIPLLEAMSCRLPVICSDISVFREVAREYPVYGRLKDVNDWKERILTFYEGKHKVNNKLADRLLNERNWKVCAQKTLDCYKHCFSTYN